MFFVDFQYFIVTAKYIGKLSGKKAMLHYNLIDPSTQPALV